MHISGCHCNRFACETVSGFQPLNCKVCPFKVVKHIEMPKACPKKSMCHFQKLEMILKWNKQNTVSLPQKYQFLLLKHKIDC